MTWRLVAAALLLPALALAQTDKVELNKITRVEVKDGVVRITGSRTPNFNTFTMSGPARLVIDISEAVFVGVPESLPGQGVITGIKTASYGSSSAAIARVLVGFDREVETDLQVEGNTLTVKVLKGPPSLAQRTGPGAADAGAGAAATTGAQVAQVTPTADGGQPSAQQTAAEAQQQAELERQRQQEEARQAAARAEQERKQREAEQQQAEAQRQAKEAAKRAEEEARQRAEADRKAQQQAAKEAAERARLEAEQQQKAKAQAAAEAARQQKLERERAEAEAKEAAKHAEEERQARLKAEREAAAEAKKAAEEDRKRQQQEAKEAARRAEQERVAQQKAQREAEAAARKRAEQARLEQERAERQAKQEERQRREDRQRREEQKRQQAQRQPARHEAAGGARTLEFVGFRPAGRGARVFIRTNAKAAYSLEEKDERTVVVVLPHTRIGSENNTRFLDTSFFGTPVLLVNPTEVGDDVHVEVKLRTAVPYQARQNGDELVLEFQAPAT